MPSPYQQKSMREQISENIFSYSCLFYYLKNYKVEFNPTAVGVSTFFIEKFMGKWFKKFLIAIMII